MRVDLFIFHRLLALIAITVCAMGAHAAGFQRGVAADPDGKPLEVGIWYPSVTAPAPVSFGPTTMAVAPNAPVNGTALPLIVISHGNGGYFLSHFDTAISLANAGFVVAAVTHTGDNYADQSRSTSVMDRPRHVSRVLDHMLSTWDGRASIDPSRVGVFGFSSGGFTALVSIGGTPDFALIGPTCAKFPADYACQLVAKSATNVPPSAASGIPATDVRIKAAVVAAPALGFTFNTDGLKRVKVPIQLWRAENDTVVPHPRYAEAVRVALPKEPEYEVVPGAGHYDFLAPCSAALAAVARTICTSDPGFDRAAFHRRFNDQVTAFFAAHLRKASGTK